MTLLWQAVVLGLVQAVTEFLPVSSSAHLTLLPRMLGWESPLLNSLVFDVALHAGTLAALLVYFRREIARLLQAWGKRGWTREGLRDPDSRLAWGIALGTIPAGLAAWKFQKPIETLFRSPEWIAFWLAAVGLLMVLGERFGRQQRGLEAITLKDALMIGLAQAAALAPGVSRSGITLVAGLGLGLTRPAAARFSFLLSIPTVLGAILFESRHLGPSLAGTGLIPVFAGVAAAGLAGYAGLRSLLAFLQRRPVYVFVAYRLLFAAAIVVWLWRGTR